MKELVVGSKVSDVELILNIFIGKRKEKRCLI
jgi:hypothetical protein